MTSAPSQCRSHGSLLCILILFCQSHLIHAFHVPNTPRISAVLNQQFQLSTTVQKQHRTRPFSCLSSSKDEDDKTTARPDWVLPWMPTWLITLKPRYQLCVVIAFYIFHIKVLCQNSLAFPFQLIPNNQGHFQSIGLDSVAGILSFVGYLWFQQTTKSPSSTLPWRFQNKSLSATKLTSVLAFVTLIQGYFLTGRCSLFWEDLFYAAASIFPLTIPMHRSMVVLFGHLTWVAMGGLILSLTLRPQPFFGGGYKRQQKQTLKFKWFTNTWDTYWLGWVLGGYFVSSWFFNIADWVTQVILPMELFDMSNSVVEQLTNPENNDLLASMVGAIAPCISAPWWEEVLYRGYLLPALHGFGLPFWPAVLLSGNIFSLTHMSMTGTIPLAVLGWTWAALYARCGNLFVTIMIHCLWNSRVFLSSWFGL